MGWPKGKPRGTKLSEAHRKAISRGLKKRRQKRVCKVVNYCPRCGLKL